MKIKNKKLKGLYFLLFSNGVKVGMSHNIRKRLLAYSAPWCRPIQEVWILECLDPKMVERQVLQRYQHKIGRNGSLEFIEGVDLTDILITAATQQFCLPDGSMSRKTLHAPRSMSLDKKFQLK
jgi:hypothetical protein